MDGIDVPAGDAQQARAPRGRWRAAEVVVATVERDHLEAGAVPTTAAGGANKYPGPTRREFSCSHG